MFRSCFWHRRPTVINNNIIAGPIMPPPMYHNCGYSNSIMKMMGWGMAFNMIQNMFGQQYQQPQNFYPYVNISNDGAGGNSALNSSPALTSDFEGLRQLYGSTYNFSKIGENYYAVSKDGSIQISGSTPEELMKKIGEENTRRINAGENGDIKIVTPTEDEEKISDTPENQAVDEDKAKIVEDGDEQPVPPENKTDNKVKNTKKSTPAGWYKELANGNNKPTFKTIADIKKAAAKAHTTPAQVVLDDVLQTKHFTNLTEHSQKLLLIEIIKKNPSVFDKKGNLKPNADIKNLDYPSMKWIQKQGYHIYTTKK